MGQREDLEKAIAVQESLRGVVDDAVIDTTIASLREKVAALTGVSAASGAIAQGDNAKVMGEDAADYSKADIDNSILDSEVNTGGGNFVGGNQTVIFRLDGKDFGEEEVEMSIDRESTLGKYLARVIAANRYLKLHGIRSGGRLVQIELENIYITLRATQKRTITPEDSEAWLHHEAKLAPGERHRRETITETVTVSVNEALGIYPRLAVLGDPGSGKTTLLRYLALVYARALAGSGDVPEGLPGSGLLPVLLPLRRLGMFLRENGDVATEGHKLLLTFLRSFLDSERIEIPLDFFDQYLESGQAVLLLDGLDEVADPDLRRRVARLVEAFTQAYPDCRYVVTSRIVGYTGAARLGEGYDVTTVRDFRLADIRQFLNYWHTLVAVGQMGVGATAETYAAAQTKQLMDAIENNDRIRELAINPLMLTVIALVHRDRVKLPDRRAELYAEAVDVLLGKWDEARGVKPAQSIIEGQPFDTGDRRLMLQSVALHMHERQVKEIEAAELKELLRSLFIDIVGDERAADKAVERFLVVIQERTGLLVARGQGIFAFSHLTFQEYLAALAVAARRDDIAYVLERSGDTWWRETILLIAGYLSMSSRERTTELIESIAENKVEPEPYHNLVLAVECLRDVGQGRVQGDLAGDVAQRLQCGVAEPPPLLSRWLKRGDPKEWLNRRSVAMSALGQMGYGFWKAPHGEPEWVTIPAGRFIMGSEDVRGDEKPQHSLHLDAFQIAKVPVTNAQYEIFVKATEYDAPRHWEDGKIPKGLENHPVVEVSWNDAMAYCRWLSEVTGKNVTLPSEAEWEKAARGSEGLKYAWGNSYDRLKCNGKELGLGTTTPVGIFPDGASPYGVLDMTGNVWEWTRTAYGYDYPYVADDGREDMEKDELRRRRGGAYWNGALVLCCACRNSLIPNYHNVNYGFRVCLRPHFLS